MKSYEIERPEDMLTVAGMMKKDNERKRAENFAVVWRVQERQNMGAWDAARGRLEIGRTAALYGLIHDKPRYLGEVKLNSARAWAKERETNEYQL